MDLREVETYGYTYAYYGDSTQLTYLRSRYYASGTGRFLTRDTWMGNISQPLSLNQWNYVNGNPINYADPSGYSPNCAIKGTCGPDVTLWFMREMANHYSYGVSIKNKVNRMKALAHTKISDPCTNWPVFLSQVALEPPFSQIVNEFYVPTSAAPLGASILFFPGQADDIIDALAYLEYGLYGLAVDYVNVNYTTTNPGCNTGKCASATKTDLDGNTSSHQTVTLCGQCRDASDLGNMMFGLGGAARGYSLALTYGSATGFNAMTDGPENLSELLQVTLFSADGWGAVPGWYIGNGQLYNDRTAFCYLANFPLGRDNNSQLEGCAKCNTLYNGKYKSPSSIYKVGDQGYPYGATNTIEELQYKINDQLK